LRSLRHGGALSAVIFVCALVVNASASSAQTLPSGWQYREVASTGGSASAVSGSQWTVAGSGANIWESSDEFGFAYRQIAGDVDIIARIDAFDVANDWSKAGVMIRESLDGGSRNAFMLFGPGIGAAFQRRSTTGGTTTRVSGGTATTPVWVRLARRGSFITGYRSADGQNWTTVSTATISLPSQVFVGLAVTSRDAAAPATASFSNVGVQVSTTAPATGTWANADVGNPTLAGSSTQSSGTFTVKGAGDDIFSNADQFQFMYQQLSGDVEVIARLSSFQAPHSWSKAGVMIRESLAAGSRHAFMTATGANGWAFQRRVATNDISHNTAGPSGTAPGWVRLVREGSLLTAYYSSNGSSWTLVGSDTVTMASAVYVGMAVASHSPSTLATGTFTNVTVRTPSSSTNQPPTVTLTTPASGATFTAPANIAYSASASDTDGTIARVEFYRGSTLVATDTTSPYTATWSSAPAGTYSLTAVAVDDEGARTTSPAVSVTVSSSTNQLPNVSLTSPTAGTMTAPATILVSATASDPDGTIVRVDLYQGTTLMKQDSTSPYSYRMYNVPAGSYVFTAVARDNKGATRTSSAVTVTVNAAGNQLPTVALTSPSEGASYTAPANMALQATASDADGTIARVEFYRGTTLIGTDTTSPYSVTWSNASAGSYSLTAKAFDNVGGSRTSAAVNVSVSTATNQLPTVSLTSPAAGATFTAPASLSIAASASDPDGTIAAVDFYVGTQLIATDTSSPYTATWTNVAAGSYSLTARARDNSGGTRTSTAVAVTVNSITTRPTSVSFNSSADHATMVSSYAVALRRSVDPVSAPPVATRDLGKPSPVSGVITVDISTLVNPLPAGTYYAVVMAIGSGGSSTSTPSATFTK
jgi:regulation of enolase protein 1 (concanavalin A-like superfamily)